ncbi:MAG: hypothetical protein JO206_13560 [Solirubrobacterales bacterium]|nr:hypothetical protein [Solirubrobacterales bacterium]
MRATRAYLAGLGTTGSLLGAAALLFFLASGFVAFHGWPQAGAQAAPGAVTLGGGSSPAAVSRAAGSRAAERLMVLVSVRGAHAPKAASFSGAGAPAGGALNLRAAVPVLVAPSGHPVGSPAAVTPPASAARPPVAPCRTCKAPFAPSPLGRVVNDSSHAAGQALIDAASGAGATLNGALSSVGSLAGRVNPALGGAVSSSGSGLGAAIAAPLARPGTAVATLGHAITGK